MSPSFIIRGRLSWRPLAFQPYPPRRKIRPGGGGGGCGGGGGGGGLGTPPAFANEHFRMVRIVMIPSRIHSRRRTRRNRRQTTGRPSGVLRRV